MKSVLDASRKKDLGAFYTHKGLSDLIATWAITSPTDTVLEPSFGGCGFLRSARDRLVDLGTQSPTQLLHGCDIDTTAFEHLSTVLEQPVDLQRFHEDDFLCQSFPSSWPSHFNTVIGNPPYLPYRKIDLTTRERVIAQLSALGLTLDRRASLWAYFVALSVPYTSLGGRAAWVLPSSFLYANYSSALRGFIARHFTRIKAFELKERQFLMEGTEEKTIVLLCEDRCAVRPRANATDIPLEQCGGVKDLSRAIKRWASTDEIGTSFCGSSVFDSLTVGTKRLLRQLQNSASCHPLGHHMQVKIGLVTGNNAFFLLSKSQCEALGLSPDELISILPRFHFAPGGEFQRADHESLMENDGKGYLVSVTCPDRISKEMQTYLATYPKTSIDTTSTFKKRSIWSNTDDGNAPDAFFPVMQHWGPRLVLNSAQMNCTNSVHRAYFRSKCTKTHKQLVALSILTTFSQISAEIWGRSYGSGALKHEPREAEKIEILMPEIHHRTIGAAFERVDKLLRNGHLDEARQIADQLILSAVDIPDVQASLALLNSGLVQLRKHRHR